MSPRIVGGLLACALTSAACGPTPPPQPLAPVERDLVVLAPDPESGEVGGLTVTTPAGAATLDSANESTTVLRGAAPGAVAVLDEAEVQRVFGPALAVLPAAARHLNFYFEIGTDQLTAESKALVAEVIALVKARPAPEVSVTGHTDTTGAAATNAALGLQRAAVIRDLLIQAGLDGSLIDVVSHGESNLLVPTPDNTAEARNRRVEITVR